MRTSGKWVGGFLAVLALVLAAGQVSAANLVANPDFETGDLSNWQPFGATITVGSPDNGPSAAGTHHAFLDNQAVAANVTLKHSTPAASASGGNPYYYSFDLNPGSIANGGVLFVQIFAEAAGGGVLGTFNVPGISTTAGWATYSGQAFASAPAGTDFMTIQFVAVTGADPGSISQVKVDNAFLDTVAVPVELSRFEIE